MLTRRTTGRVLARLLELEEVDVLLVAGELDLLLVEARHHLVVGGAGVVVLLDRVVDRGLARDDRLDVVAGQELQVVDGVEVRRVGHRDDERVAGARDGDDLVPLARLLRDELQDLGVDLVLLEVDRRDAVLLAEEARDLVVGDVAELGERVAEVLPGLLLLVLRVPQLRERDELLADEELAQAVVIRHASPVAYRDWAAGDRRRVRACDDVRGLGRGSSERHACSRRRARRSSGESSRRPRRSSRRPDGSTRPPA